MYELGHTELSEKVYQLLKRMILNREFVGGQRLDLRELALKMNISRTPLKEAVNRLVLEGLMEVKPRSGTFIAALTVSDIEEVTEIRLMIEKWCVSHLTQTKAAELAAKLQSLIEKSKVTLSVKPFDYQSFLELDIQFHLEIVRIGGNSRMLEHYKSLNSFLHASRVYVFQSYDRSAAGQDEHKGIVEAIGRFDLREACGKLEEHIMNSRSNMIEHLLQSGGVL